MGAVRSCHFGESIAFWHIFRESNPLWSHPLSLLIPPSPPHPTPSPLLFYTTELIEGYTILTVDKVLKCAHLTESYWAKLCCGAFSMGGVTPSFKLYRYVPPHRVGFLRCFGLKTGLHFAHFGLESGVVFGELRECMNVFIVSIPNE